jgi:hypothetical protein
MYHTVENISYERSTLRRKNFQRLCSSVCSKTITRASRGTQGCAQAMRRNRPDVNAAPSRPKCRQPIKPYPGQKVLTNHSVQPSVEEIVLRGICIHVLWRLRALANRVLLQDAGRTGGTDFAAVNPAIFPCSWKHGALVGYTLTSRIAHRTLRTSEAV